MLADRRKWNHMKCSATTKTKKEGKAKQGETTNRTSTNMVDMNSNI